MARHEWYKFLALNFTKKLHITLSTSNKSLFYWTVEDQFTYVVLETNDIIMASTYVSLFQKMCSKFDLYFAYIIGIGSVLHFLNYRIIQREHDTLIDQHNHIFQTLIIPFFKFMTYAPFQSSLFPLDPSFEMKIYSTIPLSEEELDALSL